MSPYTALPLVKRFQECFTPQSGPWFLCHQILESLDKHKSKITRPALHELLMPLITDESVSNKAERIRKLWVSSNKEEKDLPLDTDSRVRVLIQKSDFKTPINPKGQVRDYALRRELRAVNTAVRRNKRQRLNAMLGRGRGRGRGFRGRGIRGRSYARGYGRPQSRGYSRPNRVNNRPPPGQIMNQNSQGSIAPAAQHDKKAKDADWAQTQARK